MLHEIVQPIQDRLDQVNALITNECYCAHSRLLRTLLEHTFQVRGKLLRPIITICAAELAGKSDFTVDQEPADSLVSCIAGGLEILHTASLVHDDILDSGELRRGQPTVNAKWGIGEATLLGDWLLAKSFELMSRTERIPIIHGMTVLTDELTEGQFLEIEYNEEQNHYTEDQYRQMIDLKTASIFRAAACFPAQLGAGSSPELIQKLHDFGTKFGILFQVVDDLIDLTQEDDEALKTTGIDLLNDLKTLPVIRGMQIEAGGNHNILHKAIEDSDHEFIQHKMPGYLLEIGAVEYCLEVARKLQSECEKLLLEFTPTPEREVLQKDQSTYLEANQDLDQVGRLLTPHLKMRA